MIFTFQIRNSSLIRRTAYAWCYGDLARRIAWIAAIVLLLVLTTSLWQLRGLQGRISRLESSAGSLQSELVAKAAAVQAAEPPDFVHTLPGAPTVAQVMQTLQQAADKEGARVVSLQANDHASTDSALGHLDVVISIKATYPAILIVLQQVLDRYPGATVHQLELTHRATPTAMTSMAVAPVGGATALPSTSETEAHVLLSFWRRPLGVAHADETPTTHSTSGGTAARPAPGASAASASLPVASVSGAAMAASAARPSSGGR